MTLIDIGVNLTNKAFRSDLEAVLARSREASVEHIVITGTSVAESGEAHRLAQTRPGQLSSTAGVHPHNAKECGAETLDALRTLASEPSVVAIGECGLDYNRDFSPRPVQRQWFEEQVGLAIETQLPLFLHERDAADDFLAILRNSRSQLANAVVHCFTGSGETLDQYLELDLHIGITGWICDDRRGAHLHKLVQRIPSNRLMLETDAPYLTPRTMRPKPKRGRNEPAFLPHVLTTVSACLGQPEAEIAAATTATARRFFGLGAE